MIINPASWHAKVYEYTKKCFENFFERDPSYDEPYLCKTNLCEYIRTLMLLPVLILIYVMAFVPWILVIGQVLYYVLVLNRETLGELFIAIIFTLTCGAVIVICIYGIVTSVINLKVAIQNYSPLPQSSFYIIRQYIGDLHNKVCTIVEFSDGESK